MPVILYAAALSPPCRAVFIVAKAIGLPLEVKKVDTAKLEHMTPEFRKMNPLCTIPVLDDNGTILVDSHAILPYLVSKYGKDDSLYPKDLVKRALVDAKLHFDIGYAFTTLRRLFRAHKFDGQTEPCTPQQIQEFENIYDFINTFLEGSQWLTGDSVTVADISLFSTVITMNVPLPIDGNKYPNVRRWLKQTETLPFFKANDAGLAVFKMTWEIITAH